MKEVSAYELKRLANIERNKIELERLGLAKKSGRKTNDRVVNAEESNQEFAGSSGPGALPTKSIGKYNYQLTSADLQKEQQAFETGEGVRINIYTYIICKTIN